MRTVSTVRIAPRMRDGENRIIVHKGVAEVGAVEDEEVKGVPTLSETTLGVARVLPHVELVAETSEYPVRDGAIWR